MKMTSEKPTKPGWYIYSKCFTQEAKEAINSAPYGVILVVYTDLAFPSDKVRELVAIAPLTGDIVNVDELSGMFSEEPIDILWLIDRYGCYDRY